MSGLIALDQMLYYVKKYNIINNSTLIFIFCFIGIVSVIAVIAITLPRMSLRLNLARRAILPKVVEFTSAMRKLGLFDFDTQLAFLSAQKMHVFIADKPIHNDIQENACVKMYLFLSHKNVLLLHKGKGILCLDAEEYERVAHEVQTPFSVIESTVIAEKDAEIATLQKELLRKTDELGNLTTENTLLKQEYTDLKSSNGTAPGRSKANENLHASRSPFWLVAAPVIQQLRREATAETEYSKDDIQPKFEHELENHPALKPAIKELLSTPTKLKENTPFSLEGWAMRAICDTLRDHYGVKVKSTPGPKPQK